MKQSRFFAGAAGVFVLAGIALTADADFIDGGFESPVATTPDLNNGGYVIQSVGSSFGGPSNNAWTVVEKGAITNNLLIQSTTEYFNTGTKEYYNANSGLQDIDLTGLGDNGAEIGVAQSVATTVGQAYQLSFFVGRNSFNAGVPTPELDVNGIAVGSYTNPNSSGFPSYNGDGVAVDSWKEFSYNFTASGSSTAVAFYNLSPSGVNVNGLDDVSLTPSQIPEPSSIAALGVGGVALLSRRRRPRALRDIRGEA